MSLKDNAWRGHWRCLFDIILREYWIDTYIGDLWHFLWCSNSWHGAICTPLVSIWCWSILLGCSLLTGLLFFLLSLRSKQEHFERSLKLAKVQDTGTIMVPWRLGNHLTHMTKVAFEVYYFSFPESMRFWNLCTNMNHSTLATTTLSPAKSHPNMAKKKFHSQHCLCCLLLWFENYKQV